MADSNLPSETARAKKRARKPLSEAAKERKRASDRARYARTAEAQCERQRLYRASLTEGQQLAQKEKRRRANKAKYERDIEESRRKGRESARRRSEHPNVKAKRATPEFRAKAAAKTKAWAKANPDKVKAQQPRKLERAKELRRVESAAKKAAKAEKAAIRYKQNRERNLANNKAWHAANPDAYRVRRNRRRARKVGNGGDHTAADINDLFVMQKGKCAICLKSIKKGFHVDHRVPLMLGGSNDRKNLQLTCETCNLRKQAKDPIDFAHQLGRLL